MDPHPVQLIVEDDLERNRATVFFRLILAIPLFVWLFLWSIAAFFAAIANWVMVLIQGRPPVSLHNFLCAYIRFRAHTDAYTWMVGNPYPHFSGKLGDYPIDVVLPEAPVEQARGTTVFRIVLALPALFVAGILGGGVSIPYSRSARNFSTSGVPGILLGCVGFLGWFTGVFTARMPKGLRDAGAYSIGYSAQALAYLFILTERYPYADPATLLGRVDPPPVHPVHVADADDLRRSRVTVFFRFLLAIPHIVWLSLWSIAVAVSVFLNWFVTLFRGTPAAPLHRFNSRFVRYQLHVYAYLFLVSNPFPGFTGLPGSYPLDLVLPEPARQNRWKTFFRTTLVVPAWIVGYALSVALYIVAVLAWWVGLLRGTAPQGLHNLAVYALRYLAQTNAYLYLLTDTYPHASPLEGAEPESAQLSLPEPAGDEPQPLPAW